ncbi:MAG: histidine kinase [Saprospiraceae bacterium]|nr:histidine kinase [Saprospiraceae bacterium]
MEKLTVKTEDINFEETFNPDTIALDDQVVRIIGIPFFGLVIPSATGLIDMTSSSMSQIIGSYLYFVIIAWVVWEGNRYLVLKYYPVILKSTSYVEKYALFIGLNIFYTTPLSLLLLFIWRLTTNSIISNQIIFLTTAIIVVCVIFVTNVYEKVLYAKHSEAEQIRAEQLSKGKIQAELEALKNQIDPHFMFNALNSISYLIKKSPKKADEFLQNLAEVYRYILHSKEKDLTLLRDEIIFMNAYARLMSLRYEDSFKIQMHLNEHSEVEYLIPPVTLMVAVENAVKHNEVSAKNPLVLDITIREHVFILENKLVPRKIKQTSTGIGLKNLNDRFLKTIGQPISIQNKGDRFLLKIPMLKR